jgi:hypothetical protein
MVAGGNADRMAERRMAERGTHGPLNGLGERGAKSAGTPSCGLDAPIDNRGANERSE